MLAGTTSSSSTSKISVELGGTSPKAIGVPSGWVEIGNQNFAPGFFVWNSEVGKRSVGIQTFWYQSICQNHIVWDAVEVIDFATVTVGGTTFYDLTQPLD